MRTALFAAVLAAACLGTPETRAQTPPPPVPVLVEVVGHGEILVIVADGSTKPCDSSDNRVLFKDRAKAGDKIKVISAAGSVCVDHTYGELRQSQWAGPSIWSGGSSPFGSRPSHVTIEGSVSTDAP